MKISEAKQLIQTALHEKIYDIFYLCTDRDLFTYYIVYNNSHIKLVVSVDPLNGCVSGVWGK